MSDDLVRREEVKGALVQLYQQRAKLIDFPQRETDNTLRYINLALDAVRNLPRATAGEGMREALERAKTFLDCAEINPDNYTHDDVINLNRAAIEAWFAINDALAKEEGK